MVLWFHWWCIWKLSGLSNQCPMDVLLFVIPTPNSIKLTLNTFIGMTIVIFGTEIKFGHRFHYIYIMCNTLEREVDHWHCNWIRKGVAEEIDTLVNWRIWLLSNHHYRGDQKFIKTQNGWNLVDIKTFTSELWGHRHLSGSESLVRILLCYWQVENWREVVWY